MPGSSKWNFRRMRPSEQNRAPIEAAFFRLEDDAIPALVREAIQNSLDAAITDAGLVRVRFVVSGQHDGIPPDAAECWFGELWPRLEASRIESAASLLRASAVPFLTIEDFGTRGLEGDPLAARKSTLRNAGEKEDFFYFWRNVGNTGKTGTTRGSWGLGKAVYPAASGIRTHVGLTVRRSDGRQLLMGQSVLDLHELPGGRAGDQYDAYGFYGTLLKAHGDSDFVSPAEDRQTLDRFRRDFRLTRNDEPGFSIAIPFPADEFTGAGCADSFALAVIDHFFYPLLAHQLAVEIVTSERTHTLHDANVLETLRDIETRQGTTSSIEPLIALASWALRRCTDTDRTELVRNDGPGADWRDLSIPESHLASLRGCFKARQPVAVRVPVLVRKRSQQPALSHADVYLQQLDGGTRHAFRFLRQGLTISAESGPSVTGCMGLVVVEDTALAQLLRDAENPSHTRWIQREQRLKDNYIGGSERVRLVTSAPQVLLKRLLDTGGDIDKDLLADHFPTPAPEAVVPGSGNGHRRGPRPGSPTPPRLHAKPRPLVIQQTSGGFIIRRIPAVPLQHRRLAVLMAYDCAGTNPFKAWEPYDFRLEDGRFVVAVEGGTIEERKDNRLRMRIDSETFRLTVTGFSLIRDLAIQHRWLADEDDVEASA